MPRLIMHIYDDESQQELEERELELEDIGQVSDAIDEVVLRDGQTMKADWDATTDKDRSWWHRVVGG